MLLWYWFVLFVEYFMYEPLNQYHIESTWIRYQIPCYCLHFQLKEIKWKDHSPWWHSFYHSALNTVVAKQRTMNSCRSSFLSLVRSVTIIVLFLQGSCNEDKTNVNKPNCTIPKTSHCKVTRSTNRSVSHHVRLVVCKITDVCQLENLLVDKTNVTHL